MILPPAIRTIFRAAALVTVLSTNAYAQPPQDRPDPIIQQDAAVEVSEHAFVIPDRNVSFVPNVGIVVGSRATLVIDTGLGPRNGEIVLGEARKLSDNDTFYVTATHAHPEHDLGETAFPDDAIVIRSIAQQDDIDATGLGLAERFAGFSPVNAELLEDAALRSSDILFEDELTLDLGGVRVRMMAVGPTHTPGDMAFFVEDEAVLFAGDVVMPAFPAVNGNASSVDQWLESLALFDSLHPVVVVPSHGRYGGADMIDTYEAYFTTLRARTRELRAAGRSEEDVARVLAPELDEQFAKLRPVGGQPGTGRINSAVQAAFRETR